MTRVSLLLFMAAAPAAADHAIHAASLPPQHPAERWEFSVESGYLRKVGANSPIDYEIIPTQFSLRTPAHWTWWQGADGARLVVRARFSLLMESIVHGPEDYYFGLGAAPSIEYWMPDARTSWFLAIGGGAGVTNSTNVPGGQGQDFTLHWFAQLGLRRALGDRLSLLGGVYYLHHSNAGQTNPNPGIDVLGATLGLGWNF